MINQDFLSFQAASLAGVPEIVPFGTFLLTDINCYDKRFALNKMVHAIG